MMSKAKIISTIFIICLSLFPLNNIDIIIAVFLILSLGLVHGACDITLISTKLNTSSIKIKTGFIILYVFIAFLSFTIVYSLPIIGFISFLLISSYHFGEQHFHKKLSNSKLKFYHFLSYGSLIFLIMIETNKKSVYEILKPLLNIEMHTVPIQMMLYIFSFIIILLWVIDYKNLKFSIPKEIFNLIVICVLFYKTGLIVSFATYFVIWHSVPSIYDQIEFLYKKVTLKTLLQYLKKSGSYWAISIAGLTILVLKGDVIGESFYRVSYSFLVSVTIPHILLMTKILSKSN